MVKRYFDKVKEILSIKEITNIILIGLIMELIRFSNIINFRLFNISAHSLVLTPLVILPAVLTILEIQDEKIKKSLVKVKSNNKKH